MTAPGSVEPVSHEKPFGYKTGCMCSCHHHNTCQTPVTQERRPVEQKLRLAAATVAANSQLSIQLEVRDHGSTVCLPLTIPQMQDFHCLWAIFHLHWQMTHI